MHSTDVVGYVNETDLTCVEHVHNAEHATPIFVDNAHEWNAVEYCGNGAAGHSFCTTCGTSLDTWRGSQDADSNGHLVRCTNCGTESVYVDGAGYLLAGAQGRWTDVLDTHTVQVYGVTITYQTDLNGYTTVTAVLDDTGRVMHRLCAFLVWLESDPSAGALLVLAESWDDAHDNGAEHFTDAAELDGADADTLDDIRADLQCYRVPTDQIWFTTK